MRLGFWPPVYGNWIMTDNPEAGVAAYEYVKETTLVAEAIGFDTLLLAEHFIHPNGGTAAGLVGAPEKIAERMHVFEELGIETFLLQFHPRLEELKRFGSEVVPFL